LDFGEFDSNNEFKSSKQIPPQKSSINPLFEENDATTKPTQQQTKKKLSYLMIYLTK